MSNPTRIEINCTTGVESIIELTDAEVAQIQENTEAYAIAEAERIAEAEAKAAAKASAEAKLSSLGLTPEEIAALR